MRAIGLDVHQHQTMVAWLDTETGELNRPYAVLTVEVAAHVAALPGPQRVALEAGAWGFFVARQLKSLGMGVVAVDPLKAHRVMEVLRTAKTDRLDAQRLAQLLASGQADALAVWVPDQLTYELRQLTRAREQLVGQCTRLQNWLWAAIAEAGEQCPQRGLLGHAGRQWVEAFLERRPAWVQQAVRSQWVVLLTAAAEVKHLEHTLREVVRAEPRVAQVQSIIGCGPVTATTVVAEVGDSARFASAAHLRSYAGLVPQVRQSGEHCWVGPLPHRGNRHLRRVLVLAAQHLANNKRLEGTRLKARYWRCCRKHGPNPAKIAAARDLCDIVYALLRDGTSFVLERLAA